MDSRDVADQQYVWGLRYIDDLVLRDRDSDHNGVPTEGSYGTEESGLDQRHYAIQDGNWNVVAVVDVSGGVAERYTYSAYGKVEVREDDFDPKTSNFIGWTVLYTGRDLDMETGLQYSRARYYGADLGRFINRDPIGFKGGDENLYRYAFDWPINLADPSGLTCVTDCEDDCAKQYPHWWQYHLYVGCVNGCAAGCASQTTPSAPVKVCIRPLGALACVKAVVHCFIVVPGNQTYSYDNNGIHTDPFPTSLRTQCVTVTGASAAAILGKISAEQNWRKMERQRLWLYQPQLL